MPQKKNETVLDYINRIGSKAYAQEMTDIRVASQQRRDFNKTGKYSFPITPKFKKGKSIDTKKPKFDDDIYEDDKHPEYEGDSIIPTGPFKKIKTMTVKKGGFIPSTKYTGSYIKGDFDGFKASNPSYKKYYKGLL